MDLAALNLSPHYSLTACILLGKISSLLQLWYTDFRIVHARQAYLRLPLVFTYATVTQTSWQALTWQRVRIRAFSLTEHTTSYSWKATENLKT